MNSTSNSTTPRRDSQLVTESKRIISVMYTLTRAPNTQQSQAARTGKPPAGKDGDGTIQRDKKEEKDKSEVRALWTNSYSRTNDRPPRRGSRHRARTWQLTSNTTSSTTHSTRITTRGSPSSEVVRKAFLMFTLYSLMITS